MSSGPNPNHLQSIPSPSFASSRHAKRHARNGNYMKKTRPTEDQRKQLKALDALKDGDIDLSDIPNQGNKSGWVRGLMYRPVLRAISIRLPAPDIALAQDLAGRKGLPYQTYIKRLLHDALDRERAAQQ